MKARIQKWWSDFKTFDWKMYVALILLALVPAIYQTVITRLVTSFTSPGSLDIVGQMEWFDLIDETICAFLIIPMYSVLSKAKKTESFSKIVFKLGIIVIGLYALFSIGTFFYGIHLVSYMNPNKAVVRWIKSKKWRNYFELGPYIFVHSFIPLKDRTNAYSDESGTYYSNWREETDPKMWEDSTWGCPYKLYLHGCFDGELRKGKILVCGHWHTSSFYNDLIYKNELDKKLDIKEENPIFKSQECPGLIGLDTCTALTKKVNILKLEIR